MRGIKRLLTRASDKLIGWLNTRCYADSPSQREFLIAQGIVPSDRLLCIGAGSLAGVDVMRFDPSRFLERERVALRQLLGIPIDSPVLLFLGRITVDKGVRELLQAFQHIKTAGSNARLVLVGSLDSGSGVPGEIQLRHLESLSGVHVVGYTDSPESYLSIADILCLPSYREGFGTVVIEAAAMGVPTIGTEIYGLSDAVVHGETGLLVPPKSFNDLAKAINILLVDKLLRKRMGQSARWRALALFDARIVNAKVADEYCDLLHSKKNI